MWINPDTQIHAIVKYLLSSSTDDSRTWAVYVRQVSRQYGLEDPLAASENTPLQSQHSSQMLMLESNHFMKMKEEANQV